MSETKYCGNCGAENDKDSKYCGSCGKSLDNINTSKKSPESKLKASKRPSKYRTKRNYGILAIGIFGIALIVFSIFWLPGIIFANHYNDGFVAFDYPYNSNVTPGENESNFIGTDSSGGVIAQVSNSVEADNGNYSIYIYMSPINLTENAPTSPPIYQTVGLRSNGSAILAPVNINTYGSQNGNLDVLQTFLTYYGNSTGKAPKQSSNNGFTYYDSGSESNTSNYYNTTEAATVIVKNGTTYFFIIYLSSDEPNASKNDTDGYKAYQQIVNTFKLG